MLTRWINGSPNLNILSYFFLLFTTSHCVNICANKPYPPYVDSAMFLNQSCYFVLTDVTAYATTEEWGLIRFETVFNFTFARRACAVHGATLPIINGESENEFVAAYESEDFMDEFGERTAYRIALGMKQGKTGDQEWDDGTPVTYSPIHGWKRRESFYCATLSRSVDEPVWNSIPCNGMGVTGVGVLCKQVINPDCQYASYVSNSNCVWDDTDKICYTSMAVLELAPALPTGKPCPKDVKRECICTKPVTTQKDEGREDGECRGENGGKTCTGEGTSSSNNGSGRVGSGLSFGNVALLLFGLMQGVKLGT